MASATWPPGFPRVPDEPWTKAPLDAMAQGYDAVQHHGWYANLDPTVNWLLDNTPAGAFAVDYSSGTGILPERMLRRRPGFEGHVVEIDASAKYLRLALHKFAADARVAFRHLPWLAAENRLRRPEEIMGPLVGQIDSIACANAVHLYPDVPGVARSWRTLLRPGGRLHLQSGNIDRPGRETGHWLIDQTVAAAETEARRLVAETPEWARHRSALADAVRLAAHDRLRAKVFLPLRPLSHYDDALRAAGFGDLAITTRAIEAGVDDWYSFLAVYHEAILGWVGGCEKVEGRPATPADVADRQAILRASLEAVFGGQSTFVAEWTYIEARAPSASS